MTSGRREPSTEDIDTAWQRLCALRETESHFNGSEAQYRILASTWLLAAFAAMGFLLTSELSLDLPKEILILGISVAAATGLTLIWMLDILVYHRLLDACFAEGLKIEAQYPDLPQVRGNMVRSQPTGQVTNYVAWFYIGTINAPLVFGGVLLT